VGVQRKWFARSMGFSTEIRSAMMWTMKNWTEPCRLQLMGFRRLNLQAELAGWTMKHWIEPRRLQLMGPPSQDQIYIFNGDYVGGCSLIEGGSNRKPLSECAELQGWSRWPLGSWREFKWPARFGIPHKVLIQASFFSAALVKTKVFRPKKQQRCKRECVSSAPKT